MFNKNRSCIEIVGAYVTSYARLGLIRTEVVLKYSLFESIVACISFNKNRSCIEIQLLFVS